MQVNRVIRRILLWCGDKLGMPHERCSRTFGMYSRNICMCQRELHSYNQLNTIYTRNHIMTYDFASMGFMATANLFAPEIPLTSPVTSYLNLGTGTGLIAIACTRILHHAGYSFRLPLVDGVPNLLDQNKIIHDLRNTEHHVKDAITYLKSIQDVLKHAK